MSADHKRDAGAVPPVALAVVFGLVWLSCSYFHQPWTGANQVSRLALLHAVFQQRTLAIDAYHTLTPDKAFYGGHYYSDKAPGTAVLAMPGFALACAGLRWAGVELNSPTGWRVSGWMACAASQALLAALGATALCSYLARWASPGAAVVTALALFVGSLPLLYATTLFSHAGVAGCLAVAVWAGGPWPEDKAVAPWRDWLAGHGCGWGIASEYSAALERC